MLIQKCINLEPRELSFHTDLKNINQLIADYENLLEAKQKNNSERSEELCLKILKDCPDFTSTKLIYVQSLLANCKITEAVDFLINKLTHEEKTNEEFEYLLALAFYYDGKYDNAKKLLANLLLKTRDNHLYNNLSKILNIIEKEKEKANEFFKNGKFPEAIEEYTKLIEIDPDNRTFNSTIIANRALCHQKLNNTMEALKDINKSISLNPNYTKAYLRRGNIYMTLKMYEEAKYDFQKVKDKEPSNRDVIKLLEDAKKKKKQRREIITRY